jgi:hypothetical protein
MFWFGPLRPNPVTQGAFPQILSFKGKNVEVRAIPDLAKNERDMGHGSIGRDSV